MEELALKGCRKRIALVTGANKGVGLEICRQLASHGVMVILTVRDEERGTEAVEKLKSSGVSDVFFHQLDVADPCNVASLANFIKSKFEKLDILVNNAAIGGTTVSLSSTEEEKDGVQRILKLMTVAQETCENAKECLNINYYGMKRVTEALIPLLQLADTPRIVNISSLYGQIRRIPNENTRKEMADTDKLTEERLEKVLQSFLDDFREGKLEVNSWPATPSAYQVSKVAICTYTRMLARRYPTFCINCVNPGFVKIDINWNTGILTVEEGAKGPLMLSLLPDGSPSGFFYDQTKLSSFEYIICRNRLFVILETM